MSMQLPDNALTVGKTVNRSLAAGRWWRWSRYELRDGYICPAPGARLHVYDPWKQWLDTRPVGHRLDRKDRGKTPYHTLLEMLNQLRYQGDVNDPPEFTPPQVDMLTDPLTAESEQLILNWCARYGLLGVLPHRVLQVVFPPRDGRQLQYVRITTGWIAVERATGNPMTPILPTGTLAQPLRGVGITMEPLAETWASFFPDVPVANRETFVYPQPLTDSFWRSYAEPLQDFLSGARTLLELLTAIRLQKSRRLRVPHQLMTGGLPLVINALVAPIGIGARLDRRGRPGLNWVGNSLLTSLATMLLEDLSRGRALQCPCGQLFVSDAYQTRYCSRRCRWCFQQRNFRAKP